MAGAVYTQDFISDETTDSADSAESASRLEELRAEEQELFDGEPAVSAEEEEVTTFGLWDLVRMVIVLGLVVVAIYGVFHLLRKNGDGAGSDDDLISVLGTRGLPGNRSLHLVEVGRQVFLVGASDRSVELVAEINDKESLDAIRLRAANRPASGRRSFADVLSGVLGGGKGGSVGDSLAFMSKQKERLKKL